MTSGREDCPFGIVWSGVFTNGVEMFEKEVVIDCRGHIMGRLASVIAKELLCGQKVVCVRCEELNITGDRTWYCIVFYSK